MNNFSILTMSLHLNISFIIAKYINKRNLTCNVMRACVDSVAQVVGWRTQDGEVMGSNLDSGLIVKCCGESLK